MTSAQRATTRSVDGAAPVTLESLQAQLQALTIAVAQPLPLVDLKTAANYLGISTRTLRRLVEDEEIPYRRVGKVLRFSLPLLSPVRR